MRRSKFHNTVIHAKWKVDIPKCSKYHWCPICCEYHATRKVLSRNAMLNQRFNLHNEGWRSTVLKIWQAPCQLCLFTFLCFWLWCFRQLSVFLALQGFSGFLTSWLCWCWPQSQPQAQRKYKHHIYSNKDNIKTTTSVLVGALLQLPAARTPPQLLQQQELLLLLLLLLLQQLLLLLLLRLQPPQLALLPQLRQQLRQPQR